MVLLQCKYTASLLLRMCLHIHIYAYIHTHMHIHTYTYADSHIILYTGEGGKGRREGGEEREN